MSVVKLAGYVPASAEFVQDIGADPVDLFLVDEPTEQLPIVKAGELTFAPGTTAEQQAEFRAQWAAYEPFDPAALPAHPLRLAPSRWAPALRWAAATLQIALGATIGAGATAGVLVWLAR
jgi:hypothetical protein